MAYSYDRRVSNTFQQNLPEEVWEALLSHANHNKRLPQGVVRFLTTHLDDPEYPLLVSPKVHSVMRGDVTSVERFTKDVGGSAPDQGSSKVVLNLEPGSSWSWDPDQATYHATSGYAGGVEVIYTAQTSRGKWLDMRNLYTLSQLRGLRGEKEVIGLDAKVPCEASWKLVGEIRL